MRNAFTIYFDQVLPELSALFTKSLVPKVDTSPGNTSHSCHPNPEGPGGEFGTVSGLQCVEGVCLGQFSQHIIINMAKGVNEITFTAP